MSEPRDQELEDYLAGKSEVSRLYRQAPAGEPPPELDAKIKAAARRELAVRRPRWLLPLSAAAVLMLSVGVLLRMQQEGVAPIPAEEAATQATPAAAMPVTMDSAAPSAPAPGTDAPAVEMRSGESRERVAEPFPAPAAPPQRKVQSQAADEAAGAPSRDETGTGAPTPAADNAARAGPPAQGREPADWIEHIRRLRAEGRDTEAAAELDAFRERYPEYPLPDALR